MLVLSRREGERIRIGDDIFVTVVRINAQGVRIGIEAPPELLVIREELLDRTDLTAPPRPPEGHH
jgi:carbon storage regulator